VQDEPIHLFWTSGWDSTYRLLEILVVEKRRAQPHYIVDESRRSNPEEARALEEIQSALSLQFPEASERLNPILFTPRAQVPVYEDVMADFEALERAAASGPQTGWLACYARYKAIDDLEVSWEWSALSRVLVPAIMEDSVGEGHDRKLRDELKNPFLEVLRPFRFPVAHLTKQDMGRLAAQHGFLELLNLCWSCHQPRKGDACGFCVPCEYSIRAGLGRRLSWRARLRLRIAKLAGRTGTQKRRRRQQREFASGP
jgi:hypothetical protein